MGIYWVIINSLLMAWCGKCQSIEWYMVTKHDISTLLISKETTRLNLRFSIGPLAHVISITQIIRNAKDSITNAFAYFS